MGIVAQWNGRCLWMRLAQPPNRRAVPIDGVPGRAGRKKTWQPAGHDSVWSPVQPKSRADSDTSGLAAAHDNAGVRVRKAFFFPAPAFPTVPRRSLKPILKTARRTRQRAAVVRTMCGPTSDDGASAARKRLPYQDTERAVSVDGLREGSRQPQRATGTEGKQRPGVRSSPAP